MKRTLVTSILLISVFAAKAQPTFGVHANAIMVSTTNEADGDELNFKNRISWKVGGIANIPISETFSFMPQLNLLSKGGKIEESKVIDFMGESVRIDIEGNVKLLYLELPLNVVYNRLGETGNFFVGAGPSLSYGLTGEVDGKSTFSILGESESEPFNYKVKFDGDEDPDPDDEDAHLKALEVGVNVLAGYQLSNGLFIKANFNQGLSNISPDEGTKSKSRYFGIGIGYFFGANSRY
ncbi:MAG: outer membrane beta-barrel protein [Chitinophagaceae bacterium]